MVLLSGPCWGRGGSCKPRKKEKKTATRKMGKRGKNWNFFGRRAAQRRKNLEVWVLGGNAHPTADRSLMAVPWGGTFCPSSEQEKGR